MYACIYIFNETRNKYIFSSNRGITAGLRSHPELFCESLIANHNKCKFLIRPAASELT